MSTNKFFEEQMKEHDKLFSMFVSKFGNKLPYRLKTEHKTNTECKFCSLDAEENDMCSLCAERIKN